MTLDTAQHIETAALRHKKRKARWGIETRLRDALVVRTVKILADKETSHNAVCKASSLLMRMEAQNQKEEHRKKKRTVKKNVPPIHLGWHGQEVQNAEAGNQNSEVGTQENTNAECGSRNAEVKERNPEAGVESSNAPVEPSLKQQRRERARRWNIRPEYRDLMILRWSRIVADPKASQTALFAVGALIIRAEAQDRKDEEYRRKNPSLNKPIVVGTTRDFYGNEARAFPAPADVASSSDSGVTGAKEDRDLRAEVRQDAVKAGSLGPQSWYATGPPVRRG